MNKKLFIILIGLGAMIIVAVLSFVIMKAPSNFPIFIYHNIVEDGETTSSMSISKSKFENDIKIIAEAGYCFILPNDLLKGELPRKAVLISFDDGYRSNYEIAFPILKKYNAKAELSVITQMIDEEREMFCSWDMLKEMSDSKVFEIGSHTKNLHNPNNGGNYVQGGPNGIQRLKDETDAAFEKRVLDDIRESFVEIKDKLGTEPLVFTYPYGEYESGAQELIASLFPITLSTKPGKANIKKGLFKLPRIEVYEDTDISKYLK